MTMSGVTRRTGVTVLLLACSWLVLAPAGHAARQSPAVTTAPTIEIEDFVETPMTGLTDGEGSNDVLLSRVNAIREEVGGSNRLFISDLNGPLYIFDKATKKFSIYLDFNGANGKRGIFRRLTTSQGVRQRAERLLFGSRVRGER